MSSTSTYLNFARNTEKAFEFYWSVFGWEFEWWISRLGDIPQKDRVPPIAEKDKNIIMHMVLPILGGRKLMWTDAPGSIGFQLNQGNNVYISLYHISFDEANFLFDVLSVDVIVELTLQKMFWWDYFWTLRNQFWIQWIINYEKNNYRYNI